MIDVAAVRAKWSDPAQRDDLVYFIGRHLSKTGDLSAYEDELAALSTFLKPQEVRALYVRLKDERLEFEWRDDFLRLFPGLEPHLPALETTREEFDAAMRAGRVRAVSAEEGQERLAKQRAAADRRWWEFWKSRGDA